MTEVEKDIVVNLIWRYRQRIKMVWVNPSPYIQPLWEKSEIESKISQLEKNLNNDSSRI